MMLLRHWFTMLWLALADLRHEALLTLCLASTVAAVLAPLLLMSGLKEGVVRTWRERLLKNPGIREIQPAYTLPEPVSADWLAQLARRPGVVYLAPRRGGASVALAFRRGKTDAAVEADCFPTDRGNPVLQFYGVFDPDARGVVLSHALARSLGCQPGAALDCMVARGGTASKREEVAAPFHVTGVMPEEAGAGCKAWLPKSFLEDVDRFRRGQPVPGHDWPGEAMEPAPRYDGFLALTDHPEPVKLLESQHRSLGMLAFSTMSNPAAASLVGLRPSTGPAWIHAASRTGFPFAEDRLAEVFACFAEAGAASIVCPLVTSGLTAALVPAGAADTAPAFDHRVCVLDEFPDRFAKPSVRLDALRARAFPRLLASPDAQAGGKAAPRFTALVADWKQQASALLVVECRGKRLSVPVQVRADAKVAPGCVVVDRTLGGMLRRARQESLRWNESLALFEYEPAGYRDFHLFVRRLEDVEPVAAHLAAEGIPVTSSAGEIARVLRLDRYLERLLLIVGSVAGAAGFLALFSSLFSSVARKRRELGILQLLGKRRLHIACFPVYQSLCVTLLGIALAAGLYAFAAGYANRRLAAEFGAGGQFCVFDWRIILSFSLAGLMLACLAAGLAALRILCIQPSESIRDE